MQLYVHAMLFTLVQWLNAQASLFNESEAMLLWVSKSYTILNLLFQFKKIWLDTHILHNYEQRRFLEDTRRLINVGLTLVQR